ncbi:hypothetical protein [Nocardia yamanashiensis]|uniref:hypothetical protein n=1 Tax=Nocardia yamanashiensis TaxID=209247 RepID=UPI0012FE2010|nr:hypothetical protein [Nocardia yamanashiensis]
MKAFTQPLSQTSQKAFSNVHSGGVEEAVPTPFDTRLNSANTSLAGTAIARAIPPTVHIAFVTGITKPIDTAVNSAHSRTGLHTWFSAASHVVVSATSLDDSCVEARAVNATLFMTTLRAQHLALASAMHTGLTAASKTTRLIPMPAARLSPNTCAEVATLTQAETITNRIAFSRT